MTNLFESVFGCPLNSSPAKVISHACRCEETALRALRYFANFAFNVSLFFERIPCAKLAKYRKACKVPQSLQSAAKLAKYRKARKVPQSSRRRVVPEEDQSKLSLNSERLSVKRICSLECFCSRLLIPPTPETSSAPCREDRPIPASTTRARCPGVR